jgi:hypothetical protein
MVLAALAGCGQPTTVRIIDEVSPDGTFGTTDVELTTLDDLDTMTGEVAVILGEPRIAVTDTPPAEDRGQNRDDYIHDRGHVSTRWARAGDVAVATDLDTLVIFTLYAHVERAVAHFEEVGVDWTSYGPDGSGGQMPVAYSPDLGGGSNSHMVDNAAFLGSLDMLAFFPNRDLEEVPLAMNPGVVAHEYSHRVFYYEMWEGREYGPETVAMLYMLRSINEGLADFFGTMVTGDPRFMAHSFTGRTGPNREVSAVRTATAAWVEGVENMHDLSEFQNPYELGTVLATFLYRVCERLDRMTVERAVLAGMRKLGERLRGDMTYSIGDLEKLIVTELPATDRCVACEELSITYAEVIDRFSAECQCP